MDHIIGAIDLVCVGTINHELNDLPLTLIFGTMIQLGTTWVKFEGQGQRS